MTISATVNASYVIFITIEHFQQLLISFFIEKKSYSKSGDVLRMIKNDGE